MRLRLPLGLVAVLLAAPALGWAAPRVVAPESHLKGFRRGVSLGFIVPTAAITPEALFGKRLEPELGSFGQGGAGDCYALSVAKMYANRAWFCCDITGNAHVFVQSEAPGSPPVKVATIHYDYGYACNIGKRRLARLIASQYDHREIEERPMPCEETP